MSKSVFRLAHIFAFGIGALAALLLFWTFFRIGCIPSTSMVPTFDVGDVFIFQKTKHVELDQVVIFYQELDGERDILIKRCMGLPGDTIAVHDGRVYRNGEALVEPYLNEAVVYGTFEEYTVPEGKMFVMGDNRNASYDSRAFGAVDLENVIGRPVLNFF